MNEENNLPLEDETQIEEKLLTTTENAEIIANAKEQLIREEDLEAEAVKEISQRIKGKTDEEAIADLDKQLTELDSEQKAKYCLAFLEGALTQSGAPRFKLFWAVGKKAVEILKELQSPILKSTLWNVYREMTKQARKLKEIYDEQANFAAEQMEVAIQALDHEITTFSETAVDSSSLSFEIDVPFLQKHQEKYGKIQSSLQLLNTFATRVNNLRKELIKTDMRIGKKNKLFQQLSSIGDKVFPKRKELIQTISELFLSDVESFIQTYFSNETLPPKTSLIKVREEIKALQKIAKDLTINTQSFGKTRDLLSKAWDQLKKHDKERKKHFAELKEQFQENLKSKLEELLSLKGELEETNTSAEQSLEKLRAFRASLKEIRLGKEEYQHLQEQIAEVQAPFEEAAKKEEQKRKEHLLKQQEENRKKKQDLEQEIAETLKGKSLPIEQLEEKRAQIVQKLGEYTFLTKADRQTFTSLLKKLGDMIVETKEAKLYQLSSNDKEALDNLRALLETQKSRRKESKEQLDTLRKTKSGSGLDFEQAMLQNALINEEKERLEKIDESIKKTLEQIEEIKGKLS